MTMYEQALARAHELAPQIREDAKTLPLKGYKLTRDGRIEPFDLVNLDDFATPRVGWIESGDFTVVGVGIPEGAPADYDAGAILIDLVDRRGRPEGAWYDDEMEEVRLQYPD